LGIYEDVARVEIIKALKSFLDPNGWPFGRSVYVSEIYQLLDDLDFVDWVPALNLEQIDPYQTDLTQIDLELNDLVEAQIDPGKITIVQPHLQGAGTTAFRSRETPRVTQQVGRPQA